MAINFDNPSTGKSHTDNRTKSLLNSGGQPNDNGKSITQQGNTKTTSVSVSISPEAKLLERLENRLSRSSSFDKAKVAAIKTAIEEGRYQINVEKLAEKIIEHEFFFNE
jgi:negative regulator of flagellin synthesis FlgM